MRTVAVILAALTVGCAKNVDPNDPKTWGERKDVWVFVAPEKELRAACEGSYMPSTITKAASTVTGGPLDLPKSFDNDDVLVPEELLKGDPKSEEIRLPYSCVSKGMFKHEATHTEHDETLIRLKKSLGDTARFRAAEDFIVQSIKSRTGTEPDPFSPKVIDLPTQAKKEHDTGPIVRDFASLASPAVIYKVVFIIRGYKIDPDIECKP